MKLSDLKAWDRNPRTIDNASSVALEESMRRYGDLSSIVFNVRNNALVCGHQRVSKAIEFAAGADPEVRMVNDEWGVLTIGSSQFSVRVVDWDDETHAAANVVANSPLVAGSFDDSLGDLLRELREQDGELFKTLRLPDLAALENLNLDSEWHESAEGSGGVGDYDEAADTYIVRVDEVSQADKDQVVKVINDALEAAGLAYSSAAY